MDKEQQVLDFSTFRDLGEGIRSAHIDWYEENTPQMIIEGYRLAIQAAYEHSERSHRRPEMFFWPIAFMCRHTLELQLKELLAACSKLNRLLEREDHDCGLVHGHDLQGLWRRARSLVVDVFPPSSEVEFKPVDEIINDLHLVDPRGDGFRYRTDRNGQVHLDKLPRVLSLGHFIGKFEEAYGLLDAAISGCTCYSYSLIEYEQY